MQTGFNFSLLFLQHVFFVIVDFLFRNHCVILLQVYAPILGQDRSFHRTLFLFCCRTPECYIRNDNRCVKGAYILLLLYLNHAVALIKLQFSQSFDCFVFHTSVQESAPQKERVLPL